MKIKAECIGEVHNAKAPNGMTMTVTIKDDSSEFKLYKLLRLDVFGESVKIAPKKKAVINKDINNMSLKELREHAKPLGIKGRSKKDIIDAINKS